MHRSYFILLLILLLNAFVHFPFIDEPPKSRHVWRQTFTLSVARNFFREEMNILHPRIDNRGAKEGITGMQFPSYEFGLAAFYKVAGEHFSTNRIYALLIFSLGIVFIYGWLRTLTGNTVYALTGAWIFSWSPELFYHGFNALPDILALTGTAGSLFFAARFEKNDSYFSMVVSFLLLLLAGLTKMQFLMAGVVWIFVFFRKNLSNAQRTCLLVSGILTLTLTARWYDYAIDLIRKTGLGEVGLEFRPEQSWSVGWKTFTHNLISDLPELLLGYGSLIFFITGLILFFKRKKFKCNIVHPFLLWSLLFIAYYFIELGQMDEHGYYMLPVIPLLVLIAAYGAVFIYNKKKTVFYLFIAILPILTCIRIIPARWMSDNNAEVPMELLEEETRTLLANAASNNDLTVLVGDRSNCIWFYFLEKKGFSVFDKNDLKGGGDGRLSIENCIDAGAKVLYAREKLEDDAELNPYLDEKIVNVGEFNVYKLISNNN